MSFSFPRSAILCFIAIPLLFGCASKPSGKRAQHLLAATAWLQGSAENRALALQAYRNARDIFDRDLKEKRAKGIRAVVVDIDETVLDNSPFQARVVVKDEPYPTGWKEWVMKGIADAIPGSVDFLKYAHGKGARIFYVTNRNQDYKAATIENLKRAGFPDLTDETVVCRTGESNKEARRIKIREKHRIVLIVGDNLNDFSDAFEKKPLAARIKAVDEMRDKWGSYFVMLPNPVYGDWEGAIYDYDYAKPDDEKERRMRGALLPFEPALTQ